jgi:hypothetical protein
MVKKWGAAWRLKGAAGQESMLMNNLRNWSIRLASIRDQG